jgi:hypothetical protein
MESNDALDMSSSLWVNPRSNWYCCLIENYHQEIKKSNYWINFLNLFSILYFHFYLIFRLIVQNLIIYLQFCLQSNKYFSLDHDLCNVSKLISKPGDIGWVGDLNYITEYQQIKNIPESMFEYQTWEHYVQFFSWTEWIINFISKSPFWGTAEKVWRIL